VFFGCGIKAQKETFCRLWLLVHGGSVKPSQTVVLNIFCVSWKKLEADYLVAPWEKKRALKNSRLKGEVRRP
jgi:hypothetical protein